MATTTFDAIRDRAIAVILGLTPTYLSFAKFRPSNNKHAADFMRQMEEQPTAAFRQFQARDTGADKFPAVTNSDFAERETTLRVIVAYPQDYVTNQAPLGKQALDRDRAMSTDQHLIQYNIGFMGGRSNFSSVVNAAYPDATPLADGESVSRVIGRACDFLVIQMRFKFTRSEP